ncbi:MAG: hypothetical protein Q4G69_14675, partial [Planctomycetia bacterium]|nr:hypothetical protein [Planctomycetia bacterium]
FCRRYFDRKQLDALQEAINESRLKAWKKLPKNAFEEEACIDVDGTLAPTTGECKKGMDYQLQTGMGLSFAYCFLCEYRRNSL